MKYFVQWISVLMLLILFLTGCSLKRVSEESLKEESHIKIWVWDETFNVKAAQMAAESYEAMNGAVSIDVEIREREQIFTDIKNILSAKLYQNLPDIIMIEDYDIQEMLNLYEDEFVDLTDRIQREDYLEYKIDIVSKDGKIYGIPFDSGVAVLFYRLDILEQAGYGEEDMEDLTWERFMEIGRVIYEKTGISMLTLDPTDFPILRMMMQSCQTWFCAEDGTTITIQDNMALYHGLHIFKTLLSSQIGKSVNGWNEFISAFQNDEVACVLSGAWVISTMKSAEEQSGLWRIAPIPRLSQVEGSRNRSNIGGSSWYILKHSSASQEAAEFLCTMFYHNDTFLNELMETIDLIPCIKDLSHLPNLEEPDPFFGNQQVKKILTTYAQQIPVVNYGSNTYEIENILQQEFQGALFNENFRQCLENVQRKAEAISHR